MQITEWKYLHPEKLIIDPNSYLAEDEWKFCKNVYNFVEALPRRENTVHKLKFLTPPLSAPIYKCINEETTYKNAITALQNLFVKSKNKIFTRHMLAAEQDTGKSVDEFILRIKKLSENCNFTAVSTQEYKNDIKKDPFINGPSSNFIRQRLRENKTLTFAEAHEKSWCSLKKTSLLRISFSFSITVF